MEKFLRPVFEDYSYGTTIWSPLCGGILTGKYNTGEAPEGTRYKDNAFASNVVWPQYFGTEEKKVKLVKLLQGLEAIAKKNGVTQAQLCLAWAIVNTDVSTCMFGASKTSQVVENIKALELASNWTEELEKEVNDILDNEPEAEMDFRFWKPKTGRRNVALDTNFKAQLENVVLPGK